VLMAETTEDNVDFLNLLLMLAQTASMDLGETPRFTSGKKTQNLPHARSMINMIKAISDKTKGQLTSGETKVLFRVLGDLQAKYVKASGLDTFGTTPEKKESHADALGKGLDTMSTAELASMLEMLKKNADKNK